MSKYQFLGNFEHVKIKAHVRAELIFGLTLKLENLVEKILKKKLEKIASGRVRQFVIIKKVF